MRIVTSLIALLLAILAAPAVQAQAPAAPERVHAIRVGRGLGGMSDSIRARMLDSLAAGRSRWYATRPAAYQLAVTIGCFCAPRDREPKMPVALVRGTRITGVRPATRAQAGDSLLSWQIWSVDSLFAYAERVLHNPNTSVATLVLDRHYGFPRRFVSDVPFMTDSRFAVRVQAFVSHP